MSTKCREACDDPSRQAPDDQPADSSSGWVEGLTVRSRRWSEVTVTIRLPKDLGSPWLAKPALACPGPSRPGHHPGHPTAEEGCRPASRGLLLGLVTWINYTNTGRRSGSPRPPCETAGVVTRMSRGFPAQAGWPDPPSSRAAGPSGSAGRP